jgi:hypothetical protein
MAFPVTARMRMTGGMRITKRRFRMLQEEKPPEKKEVTGRGLE